MSANIFTSVTMGEATEENLKAIISWSVELGLTVVYIVLYFLLFLFAYLQLWLLLYYNQKRISYQSIFMFFCLLWASLRTVLFSFYLKNCAQVNDLQPFPHWLLYCFPVCLQFFSLCVLNLYFAQIIFKAKCSPEFNKYKTPLRFGFLFGSLIYLVINLTCAMLVHSEVPEDHLRWTMLARVLVNEGLSFACAVSLAVCIFKIAKMSSANVYLESKGTSLCQAITVGTIVILLYASRACYNLVVVATSPGNKPSPFNYGWDNVPDKRNMEKISGQDYVVFGVVLFFWELLPTSLIVVFFRAQRLNQNLATAGMVNSQSFGSRAYFFDNPRRYDSDDDLTRLGGTRGERGSLSSTPQGTSWYGTVCQSASSSLDPRLLNEASTNAPLLFTCGNLQTRLSQN
ncbi:integral membrane protein GPR137C isoform X1 [Rhinatrema bivittatum]|uniref:integral membrane protein GPR137C isoform X1 n=1 Tax=Rhinatrema bivittatum TaxID=194408 RepID=UPI00112D53A0|nr:integral membrane protein GPR137C isoform X1 [Rhinatrema bivittatum]